MQNRYWRLQSLDVDFEEFLCRQKKEDLLRIFSTGLKSLQIKEIASMLSQANIFSEEVLFDLIKSQLSETSEIKTLLNEPLKEYELRKPIIDYFKNILKNKYICNTSEVRAKSGADSPVIDLCIFHEAHYIKPMPYIIAIELKSECKLIAIEKAFSQAKKHFEYSETVFVCFSPLVFIEFGDDIKRIMEEDNYKNIGVLISDKFKIKHVLRNTLKQIINADYSWILAENKKEIYKKIPHPHFDRVKRSIRLGHDLNLELFGGEFPDDIDK